MQLKFSSQPGTPVTLLLGPPATPRRIELAATLEGSTDSLLIESEAAKALRDAFAAGEPVRVASTSRDTGHRVTDALPSPDLAALATCAENLVEDAEAGSLASQVSLRLEAAPFPETPATPEALQACRMTPAANPSMSDASSSPRASTPRRTPSSWPSTKMAAWSGPTSPASSTPK